MCKVWVRDEIHWKSAKKCKWSYVFFTEAPSGDSENMRLSSDFVVHFVHNQLIGVSEFLEIVSFLSTQNDW